MDPNTALRNARDALSAYSGAGSDEDALVYADALAEAFSALDGWLTAGGFRPEAWANARGATRRTQ